MDIGDRLIPFEKQFLCMLDCSLIADLIEVCKRMKMDEKDILARNASLLFNLISPISPQPFNNSHKPLFQHTHLSPSLPYIPNITIPTSSLETVYPTTPSPTLPLPPPSPSVNHLR